MEKSKLENIGNIQLYYILKFIVDGWYYHKFDYNDIEQESFKELCDESCRLVGFNDLDYVDYNFLDACLVLNNGFDYEPKKPEGVLIRPEGGLYTFDIDEHRTEYVRRTYTHEMYSYSPKLIEPTYQSMDYDGNFETWSGTESEPDYYDGETNEVKFDKYSVKKIK